MGQRLVLAASLPFILAATATDETDMAVATRFASSVADGAVLSSETLAEPLTKELASALADLRGCRIGSVNRLTSSKYGIEWKCPKTVADPKWTAVTVDIAEGQVSYILLSTFSEQMVKAPVGY